jgi:hypothetical protein
MSFFANYRLKILHPDLALGIWIFILQTLHSDTQSRHENAHLAESCGQLVVCRLDELHAHSSWIRHHLTVPAYELSALAARGEVCFRDPLVVTRERIVVDGYARWELARRQGRESLPCLQYELSEHETLEWMLERHRRHKGLNSFTRILLALDLELSLQEEARWNQRRGGQEKGRSVLTQAQRVDVRSKVASAAGVGAGSVTKVKQILATAQPSIREAVQSGEISIHRAWLWSRFSAAQQAEALKRYRIKKGMGKAIRDAVSRCLLSASPTSLAVGDLTKLLAGFTTADSNSVTVIPIRVPGRTVFLSEELMELLKLQQPELGAS